MRIKSKKNGADLSAFCVMGSASASAVALLAALTLGSKPASAVPSFARQTGQPCATCHNGDFPQLTPFGRQFKLNGYTAGGTRCRDNGAAEADANAQIPLAVMVVTTYTHTQKDLPELPKNRKQDTNGLDGSNGLKTNNNVMVQDTSLFFAGQIYCKLGAFIQATYDRPDEVFALDNADIRYADKTKIAGVDLIYGLTANNNPSVEDPWNTTPAWRLPSDPSSAFGPDFPAPLIDGGLGQIVAGGGAYIFADNMFYAAFSAYKTPDNRTLQALGEGLPDYVIDGVAPYWRLALEKTWDVYSLMVGTFGMHADNLPDPTITSTDKYTDVGWDAQFQYISDVNFFTARFSYIYEWQKLDATFDGGKGAENLKNNLQELNVSATYSYDATYTLTLGYFNIQGSTDVTLYGAFPTGSPNTSGEVIDLGFSPWSHGGPSLWPWLNTRVGVNFTHYDKINGATTLYDGSRDAKDENTVLLYAWTAF
jgi:hypothetical protein